jgi:hypothetical protein
MRIVVGGRAKDQTAASPSELARFETATPSRKENLKHRMDLSGRWIDRKCCPVAEEVFSPEPRLVALFIFKYLLSALLGRSSL